MNFRIADTFTDSLARLTGDEQKTVKTAAFDLQLNPANPGLKLHKLDKAKDKSFWSVRASADVRIIVHRTADSLLLCYVDHHDKAYAWAERHKLETHPTTGAAQLVEIRERVEEIVVPLMVPAAPVAPAKPLLFQGRSDGELLGYGVPPEWLEDVRRADEDSLLRLAEHLPAEAAEALLELATGGRPHVVPPQPTPNPFEHPDARRRFRTVSHMEELQRALHYPREKWTVFLHPEQRDWVERDYAGPARVSGCAGTGKTIVALHRAVHLARADPAARLLLATYSDTLAQALRIKLRRLIGKQPELAERIEVDALSAVTMRLYQAHFGKVRLAGQEEIREILRIALQEGPHHKLGLDFLVCEWEQIVDAWQLRTWEDYRDVVRLGRKTRLPEAQRAALWKTFERAFAELGRRGLVTQAGIDSALAAALSDMPHPPFDYAVVDEAQDIGVSQLRFLAALGGGRANALFFAGDLGQRIFQQPFSWKSLGVDVRGRARTLRINYRTSHQIRTQADRLLAPEIGDVDGNREGRTETISVFNGPAPVIRATATEAQERQVVAAWLAERSADGLLPHEIAVFVRSAAEIGRARAAVESAGLPFAVLGQLKAVRSIGIGVASASAPAEVGQTPRRAGGNGERTGVDLHHAPRQGTGIPSRGGDGL